MKSHRTIRICLDQILESRNMKESELARLTGLYPSYINSLTHNRSQHVNLHKLKIIADALNITDIRKLLKFTNM